MREDLLGKFMDQLPVGWKHITIGEAVSEVSEPISMSDSTLYRLVSIRRRNGGIFDRGYVYGRDILTKDLQRVVPGTFVIARRQIVHGACALASDEFADAAVSSSYSLFTGRNNCDLRFFSWLAKHPLMYAYFMDASKGIVIEKLNFDVARWIRYSIYLPPLNEQRKIANILDSVDESIRMAECLVAKRKIAQNGLLADLFDSNFGNTDRSGPRDSPPEPRRLVDMVELPSGQVSPLIEPYKSMPLVAPDHIESGTGRLFDVPTAEQQGAISGKYSFRKGDVLYSKIRPYLRKVAVAPFDGISSADMYPLRPSSEMNSEYLANFLIGDNFSRFADTVSMRTGIPKINRRELAEYKAVWPTRAEQDRVAHVIHSDRSELESLERQLETGRRLRQGLMDDLLTGRVRVNAGEGVAA